ncbi:MAG: hypothetical protein E4H36_02465 [Spirochaetales bacterium]|nr:MAG: hypothetical protein E4H36_02465 [Spirochaetales bacterium]
MYSLAVEQYTIEDYMRCRTCGEYFLKKEAVNSVFCSNFCTRKYTRCLNCGAFFIKNSSQTEDICSPECAEQIGYTPDEKFLIQLKGAVK